MNKTASVLIADIVAFCGLVGTVAAQDSVATTPGNSDALSAYGTQSTHYVVDLAPIVSSWGNEFYVGPVLKASADPDALFPTQVLGATAVSTDLLSSISFGSTLFAYWTTPGAGLHPSENSAPGTIASTGYDRQFAIASNDMSSGATNIVGARIGFDDNDLSRLWVSRTIAASSRITGVAADSSTLSLGGIDASGNVLFRADDFNAGDPAAIEGDNILQVDLRSRSTSPNVLLRPASTNLTSDPGATTYLINEASITLNPPTLIPETGGTPARAVVFDFGGQYLPDAGAGVTTHMDAAMDVHRGNPTFTSLVAFGGAGTLGSLAKSTGGMDRVDSINLSQLDSAAAASFPDAATITSPITSPDGFSTNAAGDAEFLQYLSQASFRGPSGPVAVGIAGSNGYVAATATDPTDGEFIATCEFLPGNPTWKVAAYAGQDVLDGLLGSPIGSLSAGAPATFSGPAVDTLRNVYFVANWEPNGGGTEKGFFKAIDTPLGHQVELIVSTGDVISGPNSGRDYTITDLRLSDADSVASGAISGASIIQSRLPGHETAGATSSFAFGGAIVNATITYDNGGTPEEYEAALFVGPRPVPPAVCDGDANGDNMVNFDDLNLVLGNWGTGGPDGDVFPSPGGDGNVNFDDLNFVLSNWGESCL